MSIRRILFSVAALLTLAPSSADAQITPVVLPTPVEKAKTKDTGTGLCIRSAAEPNNNPSNLVFPHSEFNSGINAFLEGQPKPDQKVIQSIFDLSNNNNLGEPLSYGDFTKSSPDCSEGGCGFFRNDTTTTFASRLRGFLNVTDELAGKQIHIGFFVDDAVSLTIYDNNLGAHPVVTREPRVGTATWRTTNSVTFGAAGLYPLEILYVQIVEHSALEMSYLVDNGTFKDFEIAKNQLGSLNLKDAGFTLFKQTDFFETLSGQAPYTNLSDCKQCPRQFVNQGGDSNGCDKGFFCNEAALCAPCDSERFCGPSCSQCGGDTRFCININGTNQCAGCRTDMDCGGFFCDVTTHTCTNCKDDSNCERGKHCVDHACVVCADTAQCAGTSCNCCPKGSHGQPMQCVGLEKDGSPLCAECTADADCKAACDEAKDTECKAKLCDTVIGRCVETVRNNSTPENCGDNHARCPEGYPFCLPGPIGSACAQCRSDMDCKDDGTYCLSGECTACVTDRRCGKRCTSCGGSKPFCLGDRTADAAVCVRCEKDEQCESSKCNSATHECEQTCEQTCDAETPYCDGRKCVECFADTQCPCGGTCNLDTKTCSPSCKDNRDCLGNEHCRWKDDDTAKDCAPGPMQPVECSTGLDKALGIGQAEGALQSDSTFCAFEPSHGCAARCAASNARDSGLPSGCLVGLASMALLALRRRRGRS